MDVNETSGAIPMNEVVWTEGDEPGCLMSLVKIGVATIALAITAAVAYVLGSQALMALWFNG